jgi:hypothetical protein
MEADMDLKGLKSLVNQEYKRFNESRYPRADDPLDVPPDHRDAYFKSQNKQLNDAINNTVDYAIENFDEQTGWDPTEIERELALYFLENHLKSVGWEDAGQLIDDERLLSAYQEKYPEDSETPLSIDRFYQELTDAMEESDYGEF